MLRLSFEFAPDLPVARSLKEPVAESIIVA